ncbi:hypothetical protein ILYODFUR_023905 [Ilyodon furcidens]|uniref:Uncharacterized protein n=1 Tax=Ilyodon furcidens TaxID=33524 RepID=A0ABV0V797_9TELE
MPRCWDHLVRIGSGVVYGLTGPVSFLLKICLKHHQVHVQVLLGRSALGPDVSSADWVATTPANYQSRYL